MKSFLSRSFLFLSRIREFENFLLLDFGLIRFTGSIAVDKSTDKFCLRIEFTASFQQLKGGFSRPIPVTLIKSNQQECISNCFSLRPANVVSQILDKKLTIPSRQLS